MNAVALLFIGAYLISVGVNHRAAELGAALKQDMAFARWGAALGILFGIGRVFPEVRNYDFFLVAAILIMSERNNNNVSTAVETITTKILGAGNGDK